MKCPPDYVLPAKGVKTISMPDVITLRPARDADLPLLRTIMRDAIDSLQDGYLSAEQIAASHHVMGLDTQLVRDGTYVVAEIDGHIVGCGGWSRRATLFGGDHSAAQRDARALDPATEPARIRAMYTHPAFTRRGIARRILTHCETCAREAGFSRVELMGTLSGEALYRSAGYVPVERVDVPANGLTVPMWRMIKDLEA